jgi:hypothetical protein
MELTGETRTTKLVAVTVVNPYHQLVNL